MIHYTTEANKFYKYSVAKCSTNDGVLVQLGDGETGVQIRIRLNKYETEHMIEMLQKSLKEVYEN